MSTPLTSVCHGIVETGTGFQVVLGDTCVPLCDLEFLLLLHIPPGRSIKYRSNLVCPITTLDILPLIGSWPAIWLVFLAVLFLNPLPMFRRDARYWFLRVLLRVITPGYSRIEVS
jgi:hypothetical protein